MFFAVLLCSTAVFFSTKRENNNTISSLFSVNAFIVPEYEHLRLIWKSIISKSNGGLYFENILY